MGNMVMSLRSPKSRLFRKYTGIFVVLVTGALLLSGAVELFVGYQDRRDALAEIERERAVSAALAIERFIGEIVRQVEGAANNPQPDSAVGLERRRLYYLGFLKHVPAITDISYIDANGQEQLRLSRISVDIIGDQAESSEESRLPGANIEDVYFSPVYFRNESEPFMTIAVPERGPEPGVVVAEVNLKFIWDVMSQIQIGKTGYAYAVDASGTLVAHPDISLVLKKTDLSSFVQVQTALETPPSLAKQQQAEVMIARDMGNQRVLTTYQPIEPLGWYVIVEQPLAEAFAPLYSAILRTGFFLLVGLGLAVVASLYFARRMVTPIQSLQAGAAQIGAGDLEQSIDIRTGDELEELAEEFNRMTSRLGESYAGLEQKVEQRTQELVYANAELLEARDIALEASRAKSEFLASMSHEIRTPLNAIIGMAEVLSETQLSVEQQEYLRVSRNAGDTLLNTINDILDLSKLEAGQLVLEGVDFDLRELLENTVEVLGVRAHEQGLELHCDIAPDVPTALVGDPVRLGPVITNLLGNAIKFTEKGRVVVYVENDPETTEAGALRFRVSDTGVGIPPDKLEVIFESFVQADASTTREYGGTGLGLAISRRLTELMGGRIWVDSKIGEGSTFYFTARFGVQDKVLEGPTRHREELKGLRVLVVDGDDASRAIERDLVVSWGPSVTEASNGQQALVEIGCAGEKGDPYQIVLLDRRLADMDGLDVAEQVTKVVGLASQIIMMLPSDSPSDDIARCRHLGISHFLKKPVRQSELYQAIIVGGDIIRDTIKGGAQEPAPAAHSATSNGRAPRILLVDDSRDNRMLVEAYLKNIPHQMTIAENGEIAVRKFVAGDYDLVLMDMQMPVMDGYAATRAIRQWQHERGVAPTTIIALTAYALKEEVQKSLDAGCTTHITKPIRKALLLDTIAAHTSEVRV